MTLIASAMTFGLGCSEVENLTQPKSESEAQVSQIALRADTSTVPVGGSTTLHVKVTGADGGAAKNGTKVDMTASLGRVEPADVRTQDGEARVGYRAGGKAGSEKVTAVSGTARTELALSIGGAPSSAAPAPTAAPGSSGGGFDLNRVVWVDPDVSSWPETSRITSTSIGDPPVCIRHTKAGQWPVKDGLEGNPWVFVNMNGQWYGATFEWLAPGQQCKGIHAGNIGEHIGRSPLSSWRPRSGELVGLMVSARARFRADTVRERSNVVMVRWP